MDEIRLLELLEQNARMDYEDLADILETSSEEVAAKVSDLENKQVIRGYHTVINWDKKNQEAVKAIIEVNASPERDSGYDNIAKYIYNYDEVDSMYLISGTVDFLVFIEGKTMKEVANFVAMKLAPIEGVTGTRTQFVLKSYKVDGVKMEDDDRSQERRLVLP